MKLRQAKLIAWFSILFTIILMISIFPQTIAAQKGELKPRQIILNNLATGEKIASGRKVEGGCQFDRMDMMLVKTEKGKGEWIIYSVDDMCNLIVDARWSGTIQDAPKPFREIVSREAPEGKWYTAQEADKSSKSMSSNKSIALSSTCETHKNTVRTYGYGGVVDKLTELTGWIVACRNSNGSFVSGSNNGICWAETWTPGWNWTIDGCAKYGFELQSWTVAGQQRGDFHCTPSSNFPCNLSNPDGYYHSLYLSQRVYYSGRAYCTYSASGNYVLGPWGYNLQGCY